jgi:hypothetical protein
MAIKLRVHNTSDVQQGRLGQIFEAGEVREFETSNIFEIDVLFSAPDLEAQIIGADDPAEIPEEYKEHVASEAGVVHDDS